MAEPGMVERVARAISRKMRTLPAPTDLEIAAAAIAALREPTEEMCRVAGALDNGYAMPVTDGLAAEVWRAMAASALGESA